MSLRSRFGYRTPIPTTTTGKSQTRQLSYTGGVDTYTDNDDVKPETLVLATDARQIKKGRYKTRKGANRYTVPVGEAITASVVSVAGASVVTVSGGQAVAEKLTATSTGALTKTEVNIRTTATSVGSLLVEYYTNNAGVPGTLLARSSIQSSSIGGSFAYVPSYFMSAPAITSGDVVWMVVRGQDTLTGNYEVSTTTASTNAKTSSDLAAWTTQTYSLNTKMYVSPANAVKGIYRAYRSNGLNLTTFAAASSLYSVDDVTGATTSLFAGFNAAATRYRQDMAQDSVYWVNGYEKPYKHDLAAGTVTLVSTAPEIADLAIEHKGVMFYGNAVDKSQVYFSNFGLYDTFTSTDFLTIPAPKSAHTHTAFAKLNGALYVFAKKNKFVVYGSNNATWSIDEATDQRGTFSQESVAFNENFIYHADDDGVHQFNGSDSRNLAEKFLTDYQDIANKAGINLELYDNKLYIFYAPAGQAVNTECLVYNLLLDVYEGKDLSTYVGETFARFTQDNIFIQGSNRVAALYYGEAVSNNYDNLGTPLQFELRTAYNHFDSPGQLKRIPKWRPVFGSVSGIYSVTVSYAVDNQTTASSSTDISLASSSPHFNTGLLFNTGVTFATTGRLVQPQSLFVSGEFRRIQRRYAHTAAHQPVEVDSEVLEIETQRLS